MVGIEILFNISISEINLSRRIINMQYARQKVKNDTKQQVHGT